MVIVFAMLGSIVFSYMDIDLDSAEGMTMAESNAIGEDAGLKIAEEMMENWTNGVVFSKDLHHSGLLLLSSH